MKGCSKKGMDSKVQQILGSKQLLQTVRKVKERIILKQRKDFRVKPILDSDRLINNQLESRKHSYFVNSKCDYVPLSQFATKTSNFTQPSSRVITPRKEEKFGTIKNSLDFKDIHKSSFRNSSRVCFSKQVSRERLNQIERSINKKEFEQENQRKKEEKEMQEIKKYIKEPDPYTPFIRKVQLVDMKPKVRDKVYDTPTEANTPQKNYFVKVNTWYRKNSESHKSDFVNSEFLQGNQNSILAGFYLSQKLQKLKNKCTPREF